MSQPKLEILTKTREEAPVTPVVALPGWFIESTGNKGILVINPKRGKALRGFVNQDNISDLKVEILANLIEDIARSVWSKAEMYDPDADKKFGFWLNRKSEERKIE